MKYSQRSDANSENLKLSCDIGGSTTDIAACQMTGTGSLSVIYQPRERASGSVLIQKELWLHASKILMRARVQNAGKIAWGIFRRESSERLHTYLMGGNDILAFETFTEMADWSASDETTTIKENKLLIPRLVFCRPYVHYLTLQPKANHCKLLSSLCRRD